MTFHREFCNSASYKLIRRNEVRIRKGGRNERNSDKSTTLICREREKETKVVVVVVHLLRGNFLEEISYQNVNQPLHLFPYLLIPYLLSATCKKRSTTPIHPHFQKITDSHQIVSMRSRILISIETLLISNGGRIIKYFPAIKADRKRANSIEFHRQRVRDSKANTEWRGSLYAK